MPGMPAATSPSLLHLPHLSLRSTTTMLRLGNAFADFCLGPQSQATLPLLTFASSSRYPRTIHWHLWNTDSHVSQTNARRHVLGHPFYPMWMHGITISVNIHTSCGGRGVLFIRYHLTFIILWIWPPGKELNGHSSFLITKIEYKYWIYSVYSKDVSGIVKVLECCSQQGPLKWIHFFPHLKVFRGD